MYYTLSRPYPGTYRFKKIINMRQHIAGKTLQIKCQSKGVEDSNT